MLGFRSTSAAEGGFFLRGLVARLEAAPFQNQLRFAARVELVPFPVCCLGRILARLKPILILWIYAALKRRSSTVLHAFISFS
jgi:hypothetical protein